MADHAARSSGCCGVRCWTCAAVLLIGTALGAITLKGDAVDVADLFTMELTQDAGASSDVGEAPSSAMLRSTPSKMAAAKMEDSMLSAPSSAPLAATAAPAPLAATAAPATTPAPAATAAPATTPAPAATPAPATTSAPASTTQTFEGATEVLNFTGIDDNIREVAKLRAGIFADKQAHPDLKHVLLVTSANKPYWKFYENWACAAARFGLDWAVVANDDDVEQRLGPTQALRVSGHKVSTGVGWGDIRLDYIGRNKMYMIVQVANLTGLDVLFTDADNVFLQNPFAPGVDLGDSLRARKFDYMYQSELQSRPPPGYQAPGDGGNTGFFFASARKSLPMQGLFRAVVSYLDSKFAIQKPAADQPVFWTLFNDLVRTHGKNCLDFPCGGFRCVHMCGRNPSCEAPPNETLEFCAFDPWKHPTGWDDPDKYLDELISYHANYASNDDKIAKLAKAKAWNVCNATRR